MMGMMKNYNKLEIEGGEGWNLNVELTDKLSQEG
jgi:hypothetical protein